MGRRELVFEDPEILIPSNNSCFGIHEIRSTKYNSYNKKSQSPAAKQSDRLKDVRKFYRFRSTKPDKKSRKKKAMEVDPGTITVVAGGLGTIATAVGAAMKVLWGKVSDQHKRVETALEDCQQEHAKAAEKIDGVQRDVISLNRHVGRLEGAIRARGIDPEEITE